MTNRCRLCGAGDLFTVIDLGDMPIAHRMLSKGDADEQTFPFHVVHCPNCGLSQIENPIDPAILYADFNFNFSSWKNEPHLQCEIDWIITDRRFRSAIDIGCNDGRFLAALNDQGIELCVGVEPNQVPASKTRERGFQVFNKMLDMQTADEIVRTHGRFDLVTSRQVIEHTLDPTMFLMAIRRLLNDDGLLFLDMPDFQPTLERADVSTLWEEHPSYFTEPTMRRLLANTGFRCTGVRRYDFSGGCLALTAVADDDTPAITERIDGITKLAGKFGAAAEDYAGRLSDFLKKRRKEGATIVLYGVGVRGCTAVNGYGIGSSIDFAVDDQKERQGLYVPGARLEIKPVDCLAGFDGDLVVLLAVNNENEAKVKQRLAGLAGDRVSTLSLCGPQDFDAELRACETGQAYQD